MTKQFIRSETSVAANFRAVCRARSERERFSKLCIVVEEADKTLFWMELLKEGGLISEEEMRSFFNEAIKIHKVMSAFKKRLSSNQ
jgi:four helix bundle protein